MRNSDFPKNRENWFSRDISRSSTPYAPFSPLRTLLLYNSRLKQPQPPYPAHHRNTALYTIDNPPALHSVCPHPSPLAYSIAIRKSSVLMSLRLASALIKSVRVHPFNSSSSTQSLSPSPSPLPFNVLSQLEDASTFSPLLSLEDGVYLVKRSLIERINYASSSTLQHLPPGGRTTTPVGSLPPPRSSAVQHKHNSQLTDTTTTTSLANPPPPLAPSLLSTHSFPLSSLVPPSQASSRASITAPVSLPPTENFNAHSKAFTLFFEACAALDLNAIEVRRLVCHLALVPS